MSAFFSLHLRSALCVCRCECIPNEILRVFRILAAVGECACVPNTTTIAQRQCRVCAMDDGTVEFTNTHTRIATQNEKNARNELFYFDNFTVARKKNREKNLSATMSFSVMKIYCVKM